MLSRVFWKIILNHPAILLTFSDFSVFSAHLKKSSSGLQNGTRKSARSSSEIFHQTVHPNGLHRCRIGRYCSMRSEWGQGFEQCDWQSSNLREVFQTHLNRCVSEAYKMMKAHGHATAAKLCRGAPWCKRMIWAFAHFWYSSWNRSVWSVTHGMKQANPSGSKNWKKKAKICKTKIKSCGIFKNQTNVCKTSNTCLKCFCPSKPSAQDMILLRLQLDRILRERHGDPTAFHVGLWNRFSRAGFVGVSLIFRPMEHHATSRNYLQYIYIYIYSYTVYISVNISNI